MNPISNSHLPRLTESRIEQMAAFAASHAQDEKHQQFSLWQKLRLGLEPLFASPKQVFAGAGLAAASFACIALVVMAGVMTPVTTPQQSTTQDISHSENTISEYLIQDFLDEMV